MEAMDPRLEFSALAGTPFFKLCGSGNDFVGFDGRVVAMPSRTAIAALCDRRRGVGADGVVRLAPGGAANRVKLDYWNSDGSDAALCGNGTLCSAVLARRLGLIGGDELVLETGAGDIAARVLGADRAELALGAIATPRSTDITRERGEHSIHFTVAGVPHLVVVVDDPAAIELERRGRELRFHASLGAPGANVNFVSREPRDGAFVIRTYERGVEGETLACGTGATATALALLSLGSANDRATLRTAGGSILTVRARIGPQRCEGAHLEGEGRIVFRGVVDAAE
jgi:diaminopimelate epimerase